MNYPFITLMLNVLKRSVIHCSPGLKRIGRHKLAHIQPNWCSWGRFI